MGNLARTVACKLTKSDVDKRSNANVITIEYPTSSELEVVAIPNHPPEKLVEHNNAEAVKKQ
jgi:hypothetical protein